MEQIAVSFTDGGVPRTGLTPTVNIIDLSGNKMVENGVCKELGYGWYIYNFDRYSPEKVYLYVFDGGAALSSDYDRYRFGGNELDAYSNKYSWGRTAAPYFTSINGRFDKLDKAVKAVDKLKYDDGELRKSIREVKNEIKGKGGFDVYEKLSELQKLINSVNSSVKSESSTKGVSDLNGKLDLMAEYILNMKSELDSELGTLDENVAQRIQESNTNLNEGMSSKVSVEQLLQQVERLENKMNTVLDAFVKTHMEGMLPKDITDRYDVNLTQKGMSDEDIMAALGINMGTNEGLNEGLNEGMEEGMEMGMEEGMEEGMGKARPEQSTAPVDMQGIAEPVMPNSI